jgi:ankyrin repeat protein
MRLIHTPGSESFIVLQVGYSALHLACQQGHIDVVRFLVTNDEVHVDMEAALAGGDTPMMAAVRYGHYQIADVLIRSGADFLHVNKVNIQHFLDSHTHFISSCLEWAAG